MAPPTPPSHQQSLNLSIPSPETPPANRVGDVPLSAGGTLLAPFPAAAPNPPPPLPCPVLTSGPGVGWGLGLMLPSSVRQEVQASGGLPYPHPMSLERLSCWGGAGGATAQGQVLRDVGATPQGHGCLRCFHLSHESSGSMAVFLASSPDPGM